MPWEEDRAERDKIVSALEANGYEMTRTAQALGMPRSTLGRLVEAHGLDDLIVANNKRIRRLRTNRELPPAPHEPSRQAQDQAENRAAGLCSCGQPPAPKANGEPGKMCERCRAREKEKKRRASRTYADDHPYKPTYRIGGR